MAESGRPSAQTKGARGLESVVRLYVSRPISRPPGPAASPDGRAASGSSAACALDMGTGFDASKAMDPGTIFESDEDLPPIDLEEETPGPGEDKLPPLRLGSEAVRAEAAFRLEEELLDPDRQGLHSDDIPPENAARILDGSARDEESEIEIVLEASERPERATLAPSRLERPIPRITLLLGATPLQLRRSFLEALAGPVASEGRGVLLLESALPLDDAMAMLDVALERDGPVRRRNLGVSARDILLLSMEERKALFDSLSADERRSDLVVIDLELPESILCPRLQFLVDTIVVALTTNESSLYEAYRALRGLSERRPDIMVFVVPFASSEEEARSLFDRFSTISREFLRVSVVDGGWLALPGDVVGKAGQRPLPILSAPLVKELKAAPHREATHRQFLDDASSSFFDHLDDWFGPSSAS